MRGRAGRRASRSTLVLALVVLGVVAVATGYFLGRAALSFLGGPPETGQSSPSGPATPASGNQGTVAPPGTAAGGAGGSSGATGGAGSGAPAISPGAGTLPQTTLRLPTVTLFRVQAGLFAERVNAILLADSLKDKGFPAVVSPGTPYRVVAGLYGDRAAADRAAVALKAKGQEVYVAAWALNTQPLQVRGDPALVKVLESELEGLAGLVSREALAWDDYWLEGPGALAKSAGPLEEEALRLAVAAVKAPPTVDLAGVRDLLVQVTGAGVRSVYELRVLERGQAQGPQSSYAAFLEMVLGYDGLLRGLGGGGS